MANRLLREKEQTIAATYTFAAPTKKLHFQEEILGNGDEDNAELNGQKISSMRTAKEIWIAVGAVRGRCPLSTREEPEQWLPQDKKYPARLSSSRGWSAAPLRIFHFNYQDRSVNPNRVF